MLSRWLHQDGQKERAKAKPGGSHLHMLRSAREFPRVVVLMKFIDLSFQGPMLFISIVTEKSWTLMVFFVLFFSDTSTVFCLRFKDKASMCMCIVYSFLCTFIFYDMITRHLSSRNQD